MDFLKAQIAAKRKEAPGASSSSGSGSTSEPAQKYMRRGDEARKKEEEYRKEEEQRREQKRLAKLKKEEQWARSRSKSKSITPDPTSAGDAGVDSKAVDAATAALTDARKEAFNISAEEAVRRLRAKGQPIRLFAESDKERRLRLRALELIEERGATVGQNDFMKALQGAESGMALEIIENRKDSDKARSERKGDKGKDGEANGGEAQDGEEGEGPKGREGVGMNSLLDLDLVRKDINKVYPMIYYTFKGLLRDWEETLAQRPVEVRQSTQGKLVSATQVQSAEYLKPLFKQLRSRSVAPDVLMRLAEIVHYVQKREYRHANDSYLQLSIGNAPWPIGVTMVGIHERSGREKIFSSNVAHVLNDEVSRKYIQSIKRLMTFAQTKYPPKDLAMLMG